MAWFGPGYRLKKPCPTRRDFVMLSPGAPVRRRLFAIVDVTDPDGGNPAMLIAARLTTVNIREHSSR